MNIECLVLGPLETNCYLVSAYEGAPVLVIDPADTPKRILDKIGERKVAGIILTHRHFDHIGALPELMQATKAPVLAGEFDADALCDPTHNLSDMMTIPVAAEKVDYRLRDGDMICVHDDSTISVSQSLESSCSLSLRVIHTPGHTCGSISLLGNGVLFSGDTIFAQSFGRFDLPTGSESDLARSIRALLSTLPEETEIYSGHGVPTTVAAEKHTNPFM